jgi:hypothetical protein
MTYIGLSTALAGVVVGVFLNSPERGDLSDTYEAYRTGQRDGDDEAPMSAREFNDVVAQRTLHNNIGTSLGSVGVSMILYSMIWGH